MSTTPRLRRPERHQASFDPRSLDQLLPPDHQVRVVWQFVEGLDLADFLVRIKAVPGRPGQPATDPRLLLALWLQATVDGIGSARALDTLCVEHLAYRWLCGGVSLNYHTLADFRSYNGDLLDDLLTQSVATLVHQKLVTLEEVAQDGLRVRANAGKHTFRREATLNELLKEAEERVEALKKQDGEDDGAADRRRKSAQKRAAEDRLERVKRALGERAKLAERQEEVKAANGPKSRPNEARASTTDPDARTMKMADGGFRPALNAEFATDTGSGIIVGIDVVKFGSDGGQWKPMVEQIMNRYAKTPGRMLADGDFAKLEDIQTLHEQEVVVYAPVKNAKKELEAGKNPYAAKRRDAEGVGLWRERMGTDDAKEVYKRRASTAEWANARARAMGLRQFAVRGVAKAKAQVVLVALAHNLRQMRLLDRAIQGVRKRGRQCGVRSIPSDRPPQRSREGSPRGSGGGRNTSPPPDRGRSKRNSFTGSEHGNEVKSKVHDGRLTRGSGVVTLDRVADLADAERAAIGELTLAVYPPGEQADWAGRDVEWAAPEWCVRVRSDGGGLASYAGLYFREGTWDGRAVLIGGVGNVKTHPAVRGRGYAGLAVRRAAEFFGERGVAFGLLVCEPH